MGSWLNTTDVELDADEPDEDPDAEEYDRKGCAGLIPLELEVTLEVALGGTSCSRPVDAGELPLLPLKITLLLLGADTGLDTGDTGEFSLTINPKPPPEVGVLEFPRFIPDKNDCCACTWPAVVVTNLCFGICRCHSGWGFGILAAVAIRPVRIFDATAACRPA